MTEIEFSIIDELTPTLEKILRTFEQERGIQIKLRQQNWKEAWRELLLWVLNGQGPDVSQVGSTWATSLLGLNAVLPLSASTLESVGGPQDFLPPCWGSVQDPSNQVVSSLPWTAYTFVLAYRRDLIRKAGLDERGAFRSAEELLRTARALRKVGVARPWISPVDPNYIDDLHFLASWIWASGGHFVSPDGRHAGFVQPATLKAIVHFLELFRYTGDLPLPTGEHAAMQYFTNGMAAMTIVGYNLGYQWMRSGAIAPELAANIAFAPVPGVPWIGGNNLVIWKNARMTPQREQAALELLTYLVDPATQELYVNSEEVILPTRGDCLKALPLSGHSITQAVLTSLETGHPYTPIHLWGKIELKFSRALGEMATQVVQGGDPEALVREFAASQAPWLDMILG